MSSGVLFVHNNFPSQFRDLAQTLISRGVPCASIAGETSPGLEGMRNIRYRLPRGTTPGIFELATRAEADLIRAKSALEAARAFRNTGFSPEVIVGHPGWGETLLLDEIFPQARRVLFHEFFYRGRGLDVGFDTEFFQLTEESVLIANAKNLSMSYALAEADAIVSPTPFQAGTLPNRLRGNVRIIHEGIDTHTITPEPRRPFVVDDTLTIQPGIPVITHINRHLTPMRGLHIFLRALPALLDAVPEAQVLIVGHASERGYEGASPDGEPWKAVCMRGLEDRLDPRRVHFLGPIAHARMIEMLRISTAHVYYTYPFVLSWSLLEAMSAGCYVVASDTAPVRDAISDGVNGRLLPFFDAEALSTALIDACRAPESQAALRAAARETAVSRFDARIGRAAWLALLEEQGLTFPD